MELDCDSEANLDKLMKLLGLQKKDIRYGAFDATYNEYYGIEKDVINTKTPYLTFKNTCFECPIDEKVCANCCSYVVECKCGKITCREHIHEKCN